MAGRPLEDWERLSDHLAAVARLASANAAAFGFSSLAYLGGLLHDIGKSSAAFQASLHAAGDASSRLDHSTAGAVQACAHFPGHIGRILAFNVAGQHAGLADTAAAC
ncbi:CRISPR-associated endonuclease Cas3'' [Lichenihabitans sp. PAMC28606]|uniref:CRISPR-associated endonuclease Cas3'' n=1 Tax=Lichenihabitans sp. PAMC28606 TaxID=2880932 RepID=UPI001D0A01E7|nr:CRISPR-associated endonuclease Cas3'' [Lichenihabitans sp. PAMC28606]UDL93085.1 CRISPR-associated endonuclease Cas3'' [Lichenihabitans sp. PAMC28606]